MIIHASDLSDSKESTEWLSFWEKLNQIWGIIDFLFQIYLFGCCLHNK